MTIIKADYSDHNFMSIIIDGQKTQHVCNLVESDFESRDKTNHIIDPETGEITCARCGLVLQERGHSLEQDWRAYSYREQNKRSRTGYAVSNKLYDKGLSTTFNTFCDTNGRKLSRETQNKMTRLKSQDQRAKVYESRQRNLKIALSELGKICEELHLPDYIHEQAAVIYRKILGADLVRGRSIDGFVTASVYAACRINKIPRSINEVACASSQTEHNLRYHYMILIRTLGLKPPIDGPTKFIASLCVRLNLSGNVEKQSLSLLRRASDNRLVMGKNPRGVAAAIVYLACKECDVNITQDEVAKAANTSEVTMRKRYNEYESVMKELAYYNK